MTPPLAPSPNEAPRVECHQCQTRFRVRTPARLKPSARSTCPTCGARFAVIGVSHSFPTARTRHTAAMVTPDVAPPTRGTEEAERRSRMKFSFHGIGGTLFGMQIVNICLTILTLGLYHFWAKAKIRRYMFSQSAFAGDRFAYHGTGKELYVGFLKAMLVFGIPYFGLTAAHEFLDLGPWGARILRWLAGMVFFIYVPIAIVSARRYRCTRTSWRGIRFSFRGKASDFLKLYCKGWLLTALSLGTYYPYFQTRRQAFLNSHTYFGTHRFHFVGHGSGLIVPFAITLFFTYLVLGFCAVTLALGLANAGLALLLIPLILGPFWIWLLGKKQKYFWDHTTFGRARFRSDITWQRLFTLYLGNAALLLITLGFTWPWVTVRNARFFSSTLTLEGPVNLESILQETTGSSVTGEGLSNLLDTGFEMD